MALSQVQDFTAKFNADSELVIDAGGYDYAIVQIKTPSAAISFTTSNNGTDFTVFMGTNLATQTGVTSLNADGTVRFERGGTYLKLAGTTTTVASLLVRFYKIS